MKRFALSITAAALAGLIAFASPALADDYHWSHNDSLVDLSGIGPGPFEITYYSPKSSLRSIGIGRGTVLFVGTESSHYRVAGTAYVFKAGCSPAAYAVSGRFNGDNYATLNLSGAAPIRDKNSCRILGYSSTSDNAYLHFEYLGPTD